MKKLFWGLMIACLCLYILIGTISAQESPLPYTDAVRMVYYEDENPQGLDNYLLMQNICPEAILHLNPTFDMTNVPYGAKLYLSTDKPCYFFSPENPNYGGWASHRLKFYENGRWLDEPYYADDVFYRYSQTPQTLADYFGVCINDILEENYMLAYHFEVYKEFRTSMDLFMPQHLTSCHPYFAPKTEITPTQHTTSTINRRENTRLVSGYFRNFTPLTFANNYGVCIEELINDSLRYRFYNPEVTYNPKSVFDLYIPTDALSCYNENGQRLKYYDEQGHSLETPIYSDLPIYVTVYGDTLPKIAQKTGLCLVDLISINQSPDIPPHTPIELFIPPSRPCPTELLAVQVKEENLQLIALIANVCLEELIKLNPTFNNQTFRERIHPTSATKYHWVIINTEKPPCYMAYHAHEGESIYDIERALNVCYEEFFFTRVFENFAIRSRLFEESLFAGIILYTRLDAPPCYNYLGKRLVYPTSRKINYFDNWIGVIHEDTPTYSLLDAYSPESWESFYDISQRFNICVNDLLKANSFLQKSVARKHHLFIPQTRPCYDTETGMPLIYEDADGNPLPQPQVSEHLVYYGSQNDLLPYYYNVCINRIRDANANKYDDRGNAQYLGTIIPTDRPPCYDENWNFIEYVCYDQPVDFDTDYRTTNTPITFDVHGTHCYDLSNPNTVIWYQGKPYKVQYYKGTPFESRLFTAWCFGLTMQDIYTINADKDFLPLLPYYTRAIPLPTRDCYIENPQILAGKTIHTVEYGENITSIGDKYGVPYPFISVANNLGINNTIWVGQKLIIPIGTWTEDIQWLLGLWAMWILLAIPIYGKRIYAKRR